MKTISVVTSENVGGWEWRTDPVEAEALFRSMRGSRGLTRLWHDVDVSAIPDGEIDNYIDEIYWNGIGYQEDVWGKPARAHGKPGI